MPVSRKTFGVEFSKDKFWGCIESESKKAWDKVFKTNEGYVTKAKWLRLCKELYKAGVKIEKNNGCNKKESHNNSMGILYTFVTRTPKIMFPNIATSGEYFQKYDIVSCIVTPRGNYRPNLDPVIKSLSARFDKLQKLELELRKEQK